MTHPPTPEQQAVVDSVAAGYNVTVHAVAGSGKTTSALLLASAVAPAKTLVLLYNRRLCAETAKRVPLSQRGRVHAMTIHSLAYNAYHQNGGIPAGSSTTTGPVYDEMLVDILERDLPPANAQYTGYDLVIIDEAQDLVPLYVRFLQKFLKDAATPRAQVAVYGDTLQTIYAYNGACSDYLVHADRYFSVTTAAAAAAKEWRRHTLSVSFRVPAPIAAFINDAMLQEQRIVPAPRAARGKEPAPQRPVHAIVNMFTPTYVVGVIKGWIAKYSPSDIFVLSASTRGRGPMLKVINTLTNDNVPIYVMESTLDPAAQDHVMRDKVVFSTFHKAKGLERKCVIVYGFDSSYFEFYNGSADPTRCPNELYVAVTRATHELVLVSAHNQDPLPFLDTRQLADCADRVETVKPVVSSSTAAATRKTKERAFTATGLCATLTVDEIGAMRRVVAIEETLAVPGGKPVELPSLNRQRTEDVTALNGLCATILFEFAVKGCVPGGTLLMGKHNEVKFLNRAKAGRLHEWASRWPLECHTVFRVDTFLRYVAVLNALQNQMFYTLFQLRSFDWLTISMLCAIVQNMRAAVAAVVTGPGAGAAGAAGAADIEFEVPVHAQVPGTVAMASLSGCIDMVVGGDTLVEVKCVNALAPEHVMQCCVYMYLARKTQAVLYNVRDNKMQRLSVARLDDLDALVEGMVRSRVAAG
jgi:hypothetical protein